MLIKDIFLYFSKFVPVAALEHSFVTGGDGDYSAFRREVLTSGSTCRQDGIGDYIFGINQDSIQQRISSVKGVYLFVDYGVIRSDINSKDVKTDRMTLAVTVATPIPESLDQPAQALAQDNCLSIISAIRRQMREDYDSGVEWLPHGSSELQPFSSRALANSYGWTLTVTVEAIDIV
ncbi:MAG: hypothetical protein IJU69_00165 [Bacteroidales bacterium]|nr:hypothetical protein [Bacteroidales bacterium]